jgi:hypothetical protein
MYAAWGKTFMYVKTILQKNIALLLFAFRQCFWGGAGLKPVFDQLRCPAVVFIVINNGLDFSAAGLRLSLTNPSQIPRSACSSASVYKETTSPAHRVLLVLILAMTLRIIFSMPVCTSN